MSNKLQKFTVAAALLVAPSTMIGQTAPTTPVNAAPSETTVAFLDPPKPFVSNTGFTFKFNAAASSASIRATIEEKQEPTKQEPVKKKPSSFFGKLGIKALHAATF